MCEYHFKQGKRKGLQCIKRASHGVFCNIHHPEARAKLNKRALDYYYTDKGRRRAYRKNRYIPILSWNCKEADKQLDRGYDLDKQWVACMIEHQGALCYHCGCNLLLECGDKKVDQISIDRVNNNYGHVKGNVVLSCLRCNLRRGDATMEEFGSSYNDFILTPDNIKEYFPNY